MSDSDRVPNLCSTTAGANSFLPLTVVYRQGLNLVGQRKCGLWFAFTYSQSPKQSLEFSYTRTHLQKAIWFICMAANEMLMSQLQSNRMIHP